MFPQKQVKYIGCTAMFELEDQFFKKTLKQNTYFLWEVAESN